MLHFEGDKDFQQPPAELWTKLSDARFLVQCVPGVETVIKAEPTEAVWILRPGLAFVRGTLEITLTVRDAMGDGAAGAYFPPLRKAHASAKVAMPRTRNSRIWTAGQ